MKKILLLSLFLLAGCTTGSLLYRDATDKAYQPTPEEYERAWKQDQQMLEPVAPFIPYGSEVLAIVSTLAALYFRIKEVQKSNALDTVVKTIEVSESPEKLKREIKVQSKKDGTRNTIAKTVDSITT